MKILNKFLKGLFYLLPGVLFFSYYPVISLGANETMNFEISLPMIWLIVFDVLFAIVMVARRQLKELWQDVCGGWKWLALPIFITISVLWSANFSRGILTVGVMWLVVFAIYVILKFKKIFYDERVFDCNFLKIFLGFTLVICAWCVVQCVLDMIGVPRDCTLMCQGCVTQMFGFPHPNGFAIEPQFMGNLLLAPITFLEWRMVRNAASLKYFAILLFIFVATLFLTFSRGAIYAAIVGLVFMSVFWLIKKRRDIVKRLAVILGVVIVAFVFTLNMQGLMAELGSMNDTYVSGVAKVLNHLSLGIIDLKGNEGIEEESLSEVSSGDEAVFDGYVEESTSIRMDLTKNAFKVWTRNFKTVVFGVGIGGAGQAMYDDDLTGSPKEIIQNEYASILAEVGLVGVVLFAWLIVMVIKVLAKNDGGMIITLLVAYGVSLLFFSGMANALQIYLMPVALYVTMGFCDNQKLNKKRKSRGLVSGKN